MQNTSQYKNKNLIKGMIIYALGNFGTKVLSFLIVPLYTYYISTEDMGSYDLLLTTTSLLAPLITCQISYATYRWMVRKEENHEECIRTTIQFLLFTTMSVSLIVSLVYLIHPFQYYTEFILVLITSNYFSVIQRMLRGFKNQKLYAASGVMYTMIYLTLNILQICVLGQGVKSLLQSRIIANIITIAMLYLIEKRLWVNLLKKPNLSLTRQMLTFSIPLIPNQLSWWVINSSDRYIIRYFLGNSANGIFAISYKFPTILQTILGLFNTSWQDISIADADKNSGQFYTTVFKNLYRLSFSMLLPLIPFTKLVIIFFMESSYRSASQYTAFLYLGAVFQSFSSFYGVGYLREKDTGKASSTSIYGALVNALIDLILMKFIGLQTAAISTFFGFLVMWLMREKQNRKELGILIDTADFLRFFISALILCIISIFTSVYADIILLLIGTSCFVLINRKLLIQIIHGTLLQVKRLIKI